MRTWIILAVALGLAALVPSATSGAATQAALAPESRSTIIAIANEMVFGQWVSPVTVYRNLSAYPVRWGTYYAGRTYTGMAYTQNSPQENWPTFRTNMANSIGVPGVDQGNDCSGFASIAWQMPRQRTSTFLSSGYTYKLSSLSSLLPGDGLNRPYDHIGLFYERLDNGNLVILEQTDPSARRSTWTYSYASTYTPIRRVDIGAAAPTPTPTPVPPPPTTPAGSFYVEFFANQTLSGSPVLTKTVTYPLGYDWGTGSPGAGVPSDGFSMRASGTFYFNPAGTYTFNVASDDGVRVWIDGKLVEDHWFDHIAFAYRDDYSMTAGYHTVRLEYYEATGDALVSLRWWRTRTCANGEFLGEYFANEYLGGVPAYRNCSTTLDYDWGTGSPDAAIPSDLFSARWEGTFSFEARPYTFIARADDGVRVWVDDVLIIDQWHDQGPTEYRVTRNMTAGAHTVLVRYYERIGGAVAEVRWE